MTKQASRATYIFGAWTAAAGMNGVILEGCTQCCAASVWQRMQRTFGPAMVMHLAATACYLTGIASVITQADPLSSSVLF